MRRTALACLLLLGASASGAQARDVVHLRGRADVRGPSGETATLTDLEAVLAGERVLIAAYDRNAIPRVRLMRRDGSLIQLRQYDGPLRMPAITWTMAGRNTDLIAGHDAHIAASGSVALAVHDYSAAHAELSGYRVGGFHGRPSDWRRCYGLQRDTTIAVSGTAFAHPTCHGPDASITVRDLRHPRRRPRRFAPPKGHGGLEVRMGGRFLALASFRYGSRGSSRVLQVFDRDSGREVYRVPREDLRQSFSFALQSDGKVVVAQYDLNPPASVPASCDYHAPLAWYSPAEPTAHELPYRPCGPDLALARDRIVYRGQNRIGTILYLTDVRGRPPMRLNAMPWAQDFVFDRLPPFDFDGSRIVYAEPDCANERIVRDTVAAIERRGYLGRVRCPVRFAGRNPVGQRRDGRVTATIACPSGCRASWHVRSAGERPRELLDGGKARLAPGRRTLLSRGTALPRRYSDRKPRRRPVDVVVYVEQPDGTYTHETHRTTILTTRLRG
jgi:hypothetical protein